MLLGDFPDDFYAPGDDGAGRDVLYVTNRARILAVEWAFRGRSRPVDRAAP